MKVGPKIAIIPDLPLVTLQTLYHLAEFKKLTTGTFDYFPEMSIVRWGWYLVVHRLYSILHKIVNIGLFATNCVITV